MADRVEDIFSLRNGFIALWCSIPENPTDREVYILQFVAQS